MEQSRRTRLHSLRVTDLVRVWQRQVSQITICTVLLPQQESILFSRFTRVHQFLTAQPRRFRRRLARKARLTLPDIAFMLVLGIALPAKAVTLLVDTDVPDVNPDGFCSLIEAIDNANSDTGVHTDCPAGSGADIIQLQSGSVHNITAALSGLPAQGLPTISSELTIEGNDATLHVAAVPVDRVIDVTDPGDLTLSDAIISGDEGSGTASNSARIHNAGKLRLSNVSVLLNSEAVAGIANSSSGDLMADHLLVSALGNSDQTYSYAPVNGFGVLNDGNMMIADSVVQNLKSNYYADANYSAVINRGRMRLEQSSITGNYGKYYSAAVAGIDNSGYLYGRGLKVDENKYRCSYCGVDAPAGLVNRSGGMLKLLDSEIAGNRGVSTYASDFAGFNNFGHADLERVSISYNSGGVFNRDYGYLRLVDSLVTRNRAYVHARLGAGVVNRGSSAKIVLSGVTVSGNYAYYADRAGVLNGNIYNPGGEVIISNSTVSNNGRYGRECGYSVQNWHSMTITSSTIGGTNRYDDCGAELLNGDGASLSLSRTVITAPFDESDPYYSSGSTGAVLTNYGTILKSEYNLFGDSSVTSAEAFEGFTPGPTDVVVTSDSTQPTALEDILALTIDDRTGYTILDVTDNGGPTPTVALVPGSPAIDAAGTDCVATDQRGVTRPRGAACDIGAFEAPPSFPPVFDLSSLDGGNGFVIDGVAAGDVTGRSVSDAGDLNGDGVADLLLGAPQANPDDAEDPKGVGYVVFGRDTETQGDFPARIELSALDGTNGFALDGAAYGDQAGNAVSGVGDVNGDGIDDLVITSPGSAFSSVVFGRDTASVGDFPARVGLGPRALDGSNGFSIEGPGATSVSRAGDVNDDGFADLLIGAEDASPNGAASGAGYVLFGKDTATEGKFPAVFELSDLDGSNGFVINGVGEDDHAGRSVSGAGDINHDGVADVLIGAPGVDANDEDAGTAYVVFGRDTASEGGFPAGLELASLNGSNGFVLTGVQAGDAAGLAVSGAGDVNADGIDDLLVGAPDADPNGDRSGSSYVVFGRDTASDGNFPTTVELSALDGSNGFAMNGEGVRSSGDRAGFSVSGTDDINADGLADVIIGAPGANRSYVVFGRDTASEGNFPASVELSALNGGNGFALHGANAGDGAGRVSGAGDINHDGATDVLIGAPGADPNGDRSGAGYVVFGLVSNDIDRDGIADDKDNCILLANGPLAPDAGGFSQRDTDSDGYGNVCDPDFNNSGNVDFSDLAYLKSVFFTPDADADLDGDGKVDFADLAIQKSLFFQPPGPSGLTP